MEETVESGVTFGEIRRAIARHVWTVVIVVLAVTVFTVLSAEFLYNPRVSTYNLTFTLSYPDSAAGKYPDGSPFYFRELISLDSLTATRDSDGRFSKIDVEKLAESDDISIEQEKDGEGKLIPGQFTVSVRAGYFADRTEATQFLNALSRRPVLKAVETARSMNYALDASAFENTDYANKLSLLIRQKQTILDQYDEWIALFRSNYTAAGKTLINHRAEADVILGEALYSSLASELETNGYVPVSMLAAKRSALEAERAENERKIEALREALAALPSAAALSDVDPVSGPLDLSETLASLIVRNVQIDSQLAALTEENIAKFDAEVERIYGALQEAAGKVQAVGVALYEQESRVYSSTARAVREGDIGLLFSCLVGLILGAAIACVWVCVADFSKRKKSEGAEEAHLKEGTEAHSEGAEEAHLKEDKE